MRWKRVAVVQVYQLDGCSIMLDETNNANSGRLLCLMCWERVVGVRADQPEGCSIMVEIVGLTWWI